MTYWKIAMADKQLPEGWRMVKFGEIAKHISKRVEPSETDLEIYVGLEHLDPDSLQIKRHGVPSDVAGQKLLVKKGQIIFGKRRAYQRKLGVADWDCICSAHAMVLDANPEMILPEILPFFMQSNVFMNRAVAVSEGSLSPTIKWKVLANQSFKIPNIEIQHHLFNSISKLETAIIKARIGLLALETLVRRTKFEFTTKGIQNSSLINKWKKIKLGEAFTLQRGFDLPENHRGKGDIPIYGSNGVNGTHNEAIVKSPGVVTGRSGTIGKVFYVEEDFWPLNTSLFVKDFKGNHPQFVRFYLETLHLERYCTGTGVPTLNRNDIHALIRKWPQYEEQVEISSILQKMESSKAELSTRIERLEKIKRELLSKTFG